MFIYTHTEIVPGFIAISAMLSSQYIIISGLIRDLHITAEHQLRWHADMLNVQVAVSSYPHGGYGLETAEIFKHLQESSKIFKISILVLRG